MPKVGDEITRGGQTFRYTGYGAWEEIPTSTSTEIKQTETLTELEKKADLTETQPISAVTLPLPTGAATEAKQDTLLTELEKKADLTETQPVSIASSPLPTGGATSAKQLPDDHNVNVSNFPTTQQVAAISWPLPSGASTAANQANISTNTLSSATSLIDVETNQTDGSQKSQIVDSSGNVIDAEADHLGKYHLAVTFNQDVNEDTNNSSAVNLASGATFAGLPTSTLGVVGLQWSLNTDQNCTVYIEQSNGSHTGLGTVETNGTTTLTGTSTVFERSFVVGDTISVAGETDRIIATIASDTSLTVTVAFSTTASGTAYTHYHWDLSYNFNYIHKTGSKGEGETVQATQSYWRIRVINIGTLTTTYFRVSGVLCPIATPLPSSLSDDARLKSETTITGRQNEERHAWINPTNEQAVSPVYRIVGTNFDGETLDPNFWTDGSLLDGLITQSGGEIDLHTNGGGATAASSAKYTSVRSARFVAGSAMTFEGGFNFKTAYTANNIRRVGAYTTESPDVINTPVDGFYFELNNATFSVNSRADAGTVSSVTSGSFNGVKGLFWTPTADTYYKLTIEYSPLAAFFYVNGELLHKKAGAHQSYYMTLPITIENLNTAGSTDISFETVGMYIARQGELTTNQTSKFIQGISTTVCKYGAGVIKGIVISDVVDDTEIDFYDGITTGGILLWNSGPIKAKTDYAPIPVDLFGLPFSTGLTIEISVAICNILIIYE
jgi:hypothetical protein